VIRPFTHLRFVLVKNAASKSDLPWDISRRSCFGSPDRLKRSFLPALIIFVHPEIAALESFNKLA
jgi:hypothetical protein